MNMPRVVSPAQWMEARTALLAKEKELTRHRDEVSAARRELPMTVVDKEYRLVGSQGAATLSDMFEGRRQLVVYHFMWRFDDDAGCPSCSFTVDSIGDQAHLHARDTTLVLVSRAPLAKLEAYRQRMGWSIPWYSSADSDFNYDFHVTLDDRVTPVMYNYRTKAEHEQAGTAPMYTDGDMPFDLHGVSAFLREDGRVFHTYSAYGRGTDLLSGSYNWLDLTALGRQEDWERPAGRSDGPMMSWLRRHDEYPHSATG